MKKAVFLTLGMLFLSGLVFSLALLIFHNTQGTEKRFAEISLYDRLYELDNSVQRGFRELFTRNSGMTLTLLNDSVSITETLPHSSNFGTEMDAYENYLEEAYNIDPLITVDDSTLADIKGNLPVHIMPYGTSGIVVDHSSFPSGNLRITPPSLNLVKNYSISLTALTQQSVAIVPTTIVSGTFPLRISVTTKSGTSPPQIYNVDPGESNTATLTFSDGGTPPTETPMTITLNDPAILTIDRNGITAYHNIEIALEHQAEQMTYIRYPLGLFNINIPGDSLDKTSTARLA